MIINGYQLTPIETHKARKLPEGTALIMLRIWRDGRTWKETRREYYRVVIQHRETVSGQDIAVVSAPNYDWPAIPMWQKTWIWLQGNDGYIGFYTIAPEVGQAPERGEEKRQE